MADGILLNSGAGGSTLATDDIGGTHYQRTKLALGADGVNDGDVAIGNPLPVFDGLAIARGTHANYEGVKVSGRNPDLDTAAAEDIWEAPTTLWVAPTTARLHDIASDDVNDTAAGSGAMTVLVEGLDASGVEQSETITMSGLLAVATTNTYSMVHRLTVATAGSGGANAGTISATAQTDSTITAQIAPGNNRSQMAIYKVPASKTAYVTRIWGSNGVSAGGHGELQLWAQDTGTDKPWYLVKSLGATDQAIEQRLSEPLAFVTLTLLKLRSPAASANNTPIVGGFDLVLVD
jgi:hypothetical protein